MKRSLFVILVLLVISAAVAAQKSSDNPQTGDPGPIRTSPAYAEVLLRRTELQADIEAFGESYTEVNPKMLDMRTELASLDKSLEKLFGVKPTETAKLTQALGKLIVKKAALEADLAHLLRTYNLAHPDVKRAKRRLEIFESAIGEILK
ncbi:MAG TPA: hypothetical protein VGO43_15640 [Pyrinomonadaceae bacterium]|jgi:uncharacterized protein YbjT (DUF2867 family)|nr:hypothetical protein [Pyrinomonadaceae bacterium]